MKTNNPVFGYGLIVTACAWAIAAVIIGFKYQQKSFLLTSFLAVLALLSVVTGVIIIGRLAQINTALNQKHTEQDVKLASLIHLSAMSGYLIPLANILLPFYLWTKYRHKSKFVYESGLEAVNFQLTCGVYLLSALMLCALFIGFVILPIVLAYQLLFTIIAFTVTCKNKRYHYPGNLNFIMNKFALEST